VVQEEDIAKKLAANKAKYATSATIRATLSFHPAVRSLVLGPCVCREELHSVLKRGAKPAAKAPEPVVAAPAPKAMTWRQKMDERAKGGGSSASASASNVSISDDAQFPRLGGKSTPAAAEPALANNCWRALRSVRGQHISRVQAPLAHDPLYLWSLCVGACTVG
jgi:hypothetical protein